MKITRAIVVMVAAVTPNGDGFLGYASDAWINTGGDTSTMVKPC